jgi:hypothetical protein
LLKKYSQSTTPPVFADLIGWDSFSSGKSSDIEGVIVKENALEFHFNKSVSGVLEFLSMPYYGYYNKDNFTPDGDWKDSKKIISSGSYSIKFIDDKMIILSLRKKNEVSFSNEFDTIQIRSGDIKPEDKPFIETGANLVVADFRENISLPNFVSLTTVPTMLAAVEINTKSRSFIENKLSKLEIYKKLTHLRQNNFKSENFKIANGFYLDKSKSDLAEPLQLASKNDQKHKLTIHRIPGSKNSNYKLLLETLYAHLSEHYDVNFYEDNKSKTIIERNLSSNNYDIRIKMVDIGHSAENWVIKMMFCSNLGVSFADPSGRICKLTEKYEKGEFLNQSDYEIEFERIVEDDKVIVPFFRTGYKFLVSNDLDLKSISQTTNVPRLELIRAK